MLLGLDSGKECYLYRRETDKKVDRRDHIITDGTSICSYCVEAPETVSLTPLNDISSDEWSTLIDSDSNLCSSCRKKIARSEHVPEEIRVRPQRPSTLDEDDNIPTDGCHIYYRQAGSTPSPSDHIVEDGETLCSYRVSLSQPGNFKSIEEVTDAEWSLLFGRSSNLCGECNERSQWGVHIPEEIPEDRPQYQCPYCDEPAKKVQLEHLAYVWHDSLTPGRATIHKVPREHYEQWRRNPINEQN